MAKPEPYDEATKQLFCEIYETRGVSDENLWNSLRNILGKPHLKPQSLRNCYWSFKRQAKKAGYRYYRGGDNFSKTSYSLEELRRVFSGALKRWE